MFEIWEKWISPLLLVVTAPTQLPLANTLQCFWIHFEITSISKQFHCTESRVLSSGHSPIKFGTQLPDINASECIRIYSKIANSLRKRCYFFLGLMSQRMGKEYLSTFKSLANKKPRPLSVMNVKSININLLCTLLWWNELCPTVRHTFNK